MRITFYFNFTLDWMIKTRTVSSRAGMQVKDHEKSEYAALLDSLCGVWEELGVEGYYQNMKKMCFNILPEQKAVQQIRKQIGDIRDQKSFYFKISQLLTSRKQTLVHLAALMQKGNQAVWRDQQYQSQICRLLTTVRENNLAVAESLLQLHNQCIPDAKTVTDEVEMMLLDLNQQNIFLKESFLNTIIHFGEVYDPFLFHECQLRADLTIEQSQSPIVLFFLLSNDLQNRLYRVHTRIMQLLSPNEVNGNEVENRVTKQEQDCSQILPENGRPKINFKVGNKKEGGCPSFNQSRIRFYSNKNDKQKQKSHEKRIHQLSFETLNSSQTVSILSRTKQARKNTALSLNDKEDSNPIGKDIRLKTIDIESCQESAPRKRRYKMTSTLQEGNSNSVLPIINRFRIKSNTRKQLEGELPKNIVTLQDQSEVGVNSPNKYRRRLKPFQVNPRVRLKLPKKNEFIGQIQAEKFNFFNNQEQKREVNELLNESTKLTITPEIGLDASSEGKSMMKKEIKMKPGKYTFAQLIDHLKSLRLSSEMTKTILSPNWQQFMLKCQSYICQFTVNGKLAVIAICIVLPEGDYLIKLWAATSDCDGAISISLFQKYVDYLFKVSCKGQIFFTGDETQQLLACKFIKKKQRLYSLSRAIAVPVKQQEYQNFLSLRCSNFVFPQNVSSSLFFSQQIEAFTKGNSYISVPIANIAKSQIDSNLLMLVKISEQIADMKALNSLLADEQFDTYQTTSQTKISRITAMRLSLDTHFKIPFLAGEGYLKFKGDEVHRTDKQLICRVSCQKNNTKLMFGQGFTNIEQLIFNKKKKEQKRVEFSVKMFSKQLYGSIPHEGVRNGCYGNWQVSLSWHDQLQGRLKHCMTACDHFGPQSFFVGIQIQGELLYCFQVKEQDFLL